MNKPEVLLDGLMFPGALRSFVMRIAWEHDRRIHSPNAGLAMNFSTDTRGRGHTPRYRAFVTWSWRSASGVHSWTMRPLLIR